MHRKLLDVLLDPETGEPLTLARDSGAESVEEGELVSASGNRYQIVAGVPRFVPDQAYTSSFGLQWNRFSRVQLDSANGASYSRKRFDDETGWGRDELEGKWVLDIGCGTGRFAEIAASYGAEVIALDLSSAVDAAQQNLGHLPNVHVVQADLFKLPVRSERVSFLYSIGVLQHTPDPVAATVKLVEFLPPRAAFAFTIYGRKPWTKLYSKYWVRPITRRLPPDRLMRVLERAMPVLFKVTSVLFAAPRVGRVFSFLIPVANYVDHTDLSPEVRYQEALMDTFDMLAPRYDNPITPNEIEAPLRSLSEELDFRSHVPVVVRGVRAVKKGEPTPEPHDTSRSHR